MDEILGEFRAESKGFVTEMLETLEEIEADPSQLKRLEHYGLLADRIMGTAKSLVTQGMGDASIEKISNYGELCKLVGYKGSQLVNQPALASVVVALLLDATEMMDEMVDAIGTNANLDMKQYLSDTFLDRLKWVSQQFDAGLRGTVAVNGATLAQEQIDALLKKIGMGT